MNPIGLQPGRSRPPAAVNAAQRRVDAPAAAQSSPSHWRDAHPALAAALDLTSDAVYFVTPRTLQILGANAAAAARTGYEPSELLLMQLSDILAIENGIETTFAPTLVSESLPTATRAVERGKMGRDLTVEVQWRLVDADGESLLVAAVRDVIAADHSPGLAAQSASRDHLTSLPGRACLAACLRQADERADSDCERIAILFLDVDRFKQINDAHGHLVGDQVLQAIAERLLACVRPDDLVVRYGGDEFVVLLNGVRRKQQAEQAVSRIAAEIAAPIPLANGVLTVSASIGLAMGRAGLSAADVLDEADQAMYQAKRARRAKPR